MAKDRKTLCQWKKDEIKDNFEALKEIVRSPRFVCRKCGRAAAEKRCLCKPAKL